MPSFELRYGKKLLDELSDTDVPGPVHVVASKRMRTSALDGLPFEPAAVTTMEGLARDKLDKLASEASGAGAILALGGGDAIEPARYAAWKNGSRLAVAPAPLPGAAAVTGQVAAWREDGGREVLGEKEPDLVLVDYGLIWSGEEDRTRAAAGEVMSIVTAVEDMKRAGKNGAAEYNEETGLAAMEIVTRLFDKSDDIFELTEQGIRALVECLIEREEFARDQGGRSYIEGSEHVFADCLEAELGRYFHRGAACCLGVILAMELQEKPSKPAKQFLYWIKAPWRPEDLGIKDPELARVLGSLAEFEKSRGYGYGVLREAEISGKVMKDLIGKAKQSHLVSSLQERKD